MPREEDPKTKGEVWLDIGMGWCVQYETTETWLDFMAYEVISQQTSHPQENLFWEDPEQLSMSPYNPDVSKCKPTLKGYVKWDGCMEVSLDRQHFCGADDVAKFGEVLKAFHALALKIPHVDYDCAGYPEPEIAS